MQIEAAVLRACNMPLSVETLDLDEPKAGEVLVEMKASGVCHSDWHCVTGDSAIRLPAVLGHEGSGVVRSLGPDVSGLAVGDHVALSWIPNCGRCRDCMRSMRHLCSTYLEPLWDGTMLDGTRRLHDHQGNDVDHLSALSTWSTHAVVPAISCVRMPEVPFEISALIGCGVTTGVGAALNKADVQPGSSVVVFGAGGVGLSIVMGAVVAEATQIIVVDRQPDKELLARQLGATDFILSDGAPEAIEDLTAGQGCDFAFDAVGHPAVEELLLSVLGRNGLAVLVGLPGPGTRFTVDPVEFIRAEKRLTGSIFGSADTARDFVAYAELYRCGQLPLDNLITDRYSLDQVNEACADMLSGTVGRGVIVF